MREFEFRVNLLRWSLKCLIVSEEEIYVAVCKITPMEFETLRFGLAFLRNLGVKLLRWSLKSTSEFYIGVFIWRVIYSTEFQICRFT